MVTVQKETKISAVILAGGENKRFKGKTKANIQISGIRIITRAIKTLHDIFDEIIIVTNKPEDFKSFSQYKIIPDIITHAGPLGGIHAAMSVAEGDAVFCFASDMPCLSGNIIRKQIDFFNLTRFDATIPQINDFIEPLHGIYKKEIHTNLHEFLLNAPHLSIRNFMESIDVKYYTLEDSCDIRVSNLSLFSSRKIIKPRIVSTNKSSAETTLA